MQGRECSPWMQLLAMQVSLNGQIGQPCERGGSVLERFQAGLRFEIAIQHRLETMERVLSCGHEMKLSVRRHF